jgi:hypothetical protein
MFTRREYMLRQAQAVYKAVCKARLLRQTQAPWPARRVSARIRARVCHETHERTGTPSSRLDHTSTSVPRDA